MYGIHANIWGILMVKVAICCHIWHTWSIWGRNLSLKKTLTKLVNTTPVISGRRGHNWAPACMGMLQGFLHSIHGGWPHQEHGYILGMSLGESCYMICYVYIYNLIHWGYHIPMFEFAWTWDICKSIYIYIYIYMCIPFICYINMYTILRHPGRKTRQKGVANDEWNTSVHPMLSPIPRLNWIVLLGMAKLWHFAPNLVEAGQYICRIYVYLYNINTYTHFHFLMCIF